jgi:hypothetical protein
MAIIVFEARATSGRRLRQGFPQSNSDRNSYRRATRHAVYQESQNSLHTNATSAVENEKKKKMKKMKKTNKKNKKKYK